MKEAKIINGDTDFIKKKALEIMNLPFEPMQSGKGKTVSKKAINNRLVNLLTKWFNEDNPNPAT